MWHRANTFYNPDEAWVYVEEILSDENIGKIGHNMKFDVLFTFCTTNCRIKNILFDTMLLLHAKDSGTQGIMGLKQAVWDYLPETELGGYEDLLPSLHTAKQIEKLEGEEDEETTESD
jgi:DNA polymerase I-like protein with 3'-5' exonuclease and polymerase domains